MSSSFCLQRICLSLLILLNVSLLPSSLVSIHQQCYRVGHNQDKIGIGISRYHCTFLILVHCPVRSFSPFLSLRPHQFTFQYNSLCRRVFEASLADSVALEIDWGIKSASSVIPFLRSLVILLLLLPWYENFAGTTKVSKCNLLQKARRRRSRRVWLSHAQNICSVISNILFVVVRRFVDAMEEDKNHPVKIKWTERRASIYK